MSSILLKQNGHSIVLVLRELNVYHLDSGLHILTILFLIIYSDSPFSCVLGYNNRAEFNTAFCSRSLVFVRAAWCSLHTLQSITGKHVCDKCWKGLKKYRNFHTFADPPDLKCGIKIKVQKGAKNHGLN